MDSRGPGVTPGTGCHGQSPTLAFLSHSHGLLILDQAGRRLTQAAPVMAANGDSGQGEAVAAVAGTAETSWLMLPKQAGGRFTMPRPSITCLASLVRLQTSFAM